MNLNRSSNTPIRSIIPKEILKIPYAETRTYKEIDQLGGDDPYSASKASAENIFNAYAKSFFCNQNQCMMSILKLL